VGRLKSMKYQDYLNGLDKGVIRPIVPTANIHLNNETLMFMEADELVVFGEWLRVFKKGKCIAIYKMEMVKFAYIIEM
jgi:hypothetical protein